MTGQQPPDLVLMLSEVMHRFGDTWQIERHPGQHVWTAVRRPVVVSPLEVHNAFTLEELAAKLEKAGD